MDDRFGSSHGIPSFRCKHSARPSRHLDQSFRFPWTVRILLALPFHVYRSPSNASLSFFLEATAAAYAFSSPEGDLPASVAIAWSLWAIFAHQTVSQSGKFIHWSALGFSILALVWVVKGAWGLFSKSRGGVSLEDDLERAPLVGSS